MNLGLNMPWSRDLIYLKGYKIDCIKVNTDNSKCTVPLDINIYLLD